MRACWDVFKGLEKHRDVYLNFFKSELADSSSKVDSCIRRDVDQNIFNGF
jgi:hypothetical protein